MSRKINLVLVTIIVTLFLFVNLLFTAKIKISAEFFSTNIRVDDTEQNLTSQGGPAIAVDGQGTIHVVWEDWRNDQDGRLVTDGGIDGVNNADIYYSKSTDGGITFNINRKVNINTDASQQEAPSIAVDGTGKIHVIWGDWRNDADGRFISGGGIDGVNDEDVYYANSTDGGLTWSSGQRINDDSGSAVQGPGFECIDVDENNRIHIVWIDTRNTFSGDIYYANSTDGGLSFSKNKKINDVSKASSDPAIAVDDNNIIFVTWVDDRNDTTKSDIFFSKSADGGISFSPDIKINDDGLPITYQGNPAIAAHGGFVAIAWSDQRNQNCIYFANSTDSGDNFSTNKRVDDDILGKPKSTPSITVNSLGYVYIAWRDKRNDNEDIYFANSTDGGGSFSINQRINDDVGSSYQRFPAIATKNNIIYIVWQDDRNGKWDIYFARSNLSPLMTTPISPPNDTTLTVNTPTLVVTAVSDQDGDTVYYNFTISNQTDAESGTNYSSGWIDTPNWITPPLANGKWFWHTYTTDMWNTTAPDWVWNFTVDTIPPIITNLQPPDTSTMNDNTSTIGANYSDPSGINVSSVLLEIDGVDETSNATITVSGVNYTSGTPLLDSTYLIYLEIEDSVGNLATTTWIFTVDTTSPTIANLQPPHLSTTNDGTPTIGADYSDPSGINVSSVVLKVDSDDVTSFATVTASNVTYVPISELTSGLHTVYLEVNDILGNSAMTFWSFTIDKIPTIEIWESGGSPSQTYIKGDLILITWTASDDNTLPINPINITYGNSTGGWTNIASGEANDGSYLWNTSNVPCSGSFLINISVYDSISQTTVDVGNYSFNIECPDITPPTANAGPDKSINVRATVNFDGSASSDNIDSIDQLNFTWEITKEGDSITTLYDLYPLFTFNNTGQYEVNLTVRDTSGNEGYDTQIVKVTPPSKPKDFLSEYWWILVIFLIIIILLILLFGFRWRKKKSEVEEEIEPSKLKEEIEPSDISEGDEQTTIKEN